MITTARPRLGTMFHPLGFALLPVLFLYAYNMSELHLEELVRPLLAAGLAALVVWGLLRLLLRDWSRAAVLASCFWVWFCSFGPVLRLQDRVPQAVYPTLLVAYALVWPALLVVALDRKWEGRRPSAALNLMAVALVAFQVVRIGGFEWRRAHTAAPSRATHSTVRFTGRSPEERPNIYFIVLDGYAREDVMRERYGYDNGAFLRYLESAGFQVAHRARANYCQTALSLSSGLNLNYVDDLARTMGPEATDRTPLERAFNDNETTRFLRARGYRVIAFASGYFGTEMRSADVYWRGLAGSEFQTTLLEATPIVFLERALGLGAETPGHRRSRQVLYTFDHLAEAGRTDQPVFVFAHIIAPHPPFMFHADGTLEEREGSSGFADGATICGRPEDYVRGYREQAKFITRRTQQAIEEILTRAPRPTAIVLLSDHGPGSTLDWDNMRTMRLEERFGTLLAVRLPGRRARLGDDASTVNVWRLVLREYFGADLPPLPSVSYASTFNFPYRLTRITNEKGDFGWPKREVPPRADSTPPARRP